MALTLQIRRTAALAAFVAVLGLAAAPPAGAAIRARRVAGGLDAPVAFTFDPRGRIWYVEKASGEIHVLNRVTGRDRRFADVPGVRAEGERGMLGIALHPRYPARPFVYVYATRAVDGRLRNQVLRITDAGGRGGRMRTILSTAASATPYHNGGRILFGPDGMLYVVIGDAHDPANAQQLGDPRGKVLRITPTGRIPPDNPLGERRVYAYGIRNSFGLAFDPRTDVLWESENGPECNDELNRIVPGENYGWGPNATCSGSGPGNTNRDGPSPELPVLWWRDTFAPTGLAFCRGCRLGARSEGALFLGAANTGDIRRIRLNADRDRAVRRAIVHRHPGPVLSMEVGPDGRIYFSDFDAIHVLVRRR
jgi:quinoprotein glucose dehydrogenase